MPKIGCSTVCTALVTSRANAIPERDSINYFDPAVYNLCKAAGGHQDHCKARSYACLCSASLSLHCARIQILRMLNSKRAPCLTSKGNGRSRSLLAVIACAIRVQVARPIGVVAVTVMLLATACTSNVASQKVEPFRFVGSERVTLPELLNPAWSGYLLDGDRLYTIDTRAKQVLVFTDSGALVRAIGREGRGPGEFMHPRTLDVRKNRLAVSQRSGQISLFDTTGIYLHSFYALHVNLIGGNVKFLNDSLLVVTGPLLAKEPYTGTMAHIYTLEGVLLRDFLWLSEKASKYESGSMAYAYCDQDWNTETFWCIQSMEYIVYHFDHDGNLLDSLLIAPPHYRPLNSREPVDVRSGKHSSWMQSWDRLGGISTVNDTLLAVTLTAATLGLKTDIIDARDGTVLTTYHFGWANQSIVEADPVSLRLLLRSRGDPEDGSIVEFLPISAIRGSLK